MFGFKNRILHDKSCYSLNVFYIDFGPILDCLSNLDYQELELIERAIKTLKKQLKIISLFFLSCFLLWKTSSPEKAPRVEKTIPYKNYWFRTSLGATISYHSWSVAEKMKERRVLFFELPFEYYHKFYESGAFFSARKNIRIIQPLFTQLQNQHHNLHGMRRLGYAWAVKENTKPHKSEPTSCFHRIFLVQEDFLSTGIDRIYTAAGSCPFSGKGILTCFMGPKTMNFDLWALKNCQVSI